MSALPELTPQQIAANHAKMWKDFYGNGDPGVVGQVAIMAKNVEKNTEHREKWERRELIFMGAMVMLVAMLGIAAVYGGQQLGEILDLLAELRKAVQ